MAILAPLQEGTQALPSEEVANEGARALRKVNLERFKETSTWRGRVLLRRRTSRTPTRHGCLTTLSSPWKCRRGRMISGRPERGLFCPLELDDPEDIFHIQDIKEKYVPYIRRLRESQNPWHQEALLEEMPDLVAPAPPQACQGDQLGGGQAVPAPLGDEEAPGRATDVWEEALKR